VSSVYYGFLPPQATPVLGAGKKTTLYLIGGGQFAGQSAIFSSPNHARSGDHSLVAGESLAPSMYHYLIEQIGKHGKSEHAERWKNPIEGCRG